MTMVPPVLAPLSDASFHAVQRRLAQLLPDAITQESGGTLETAGLFGQDKPRLDPPEVIEGTVVRAHDVRGAAEARFAAFLDGTQRSRISQYLGGVPIVHGTVAAVVRARRNQRMLSWAPPTVARRLYAPLDLLPAKVRAALAGSGVEVRDTLADRKPESIHPFALQEIALQAVQRDRAAVERSLAEAWCAANEGELFVDGGISESEIVATSPRVVGVVKSHLQIYVDDDALGVIMRLRSGERSSVVRVTSRRRTPVASWYLRMRHAPGRDPLWGLVRVEVAEPRGASAREIGARANDVSRWVLAEALPLAVPDGRWDKMVYGIRDCEEFLRAIQ